MAGLADAGEGPMRQGKHMMDNHAKRNLRGLVASAIFAAVLGLGSGTASATAFLADFQAPRPFTAGNMPTNFDDTTNITGDVFDFTFTGGGDFTIAGNQGESSSDGIFATSIPVDPGDEFVTIVLNADSTATFFFVSIFIDSFGPDMFLEGIFGGVLQYSTTVGAGSGVEPSGDNAQLVDTVRLRSADFDSLVFDSFRGSFAMDMQPVPEPGTLALFVTGLIGLGLLSRRRRQS